MDPVVHFEMSYDDAQRAAKFYEAAFGWHMQMLGAEMGDYVLATTTTTDESGRPTSPGAINGGLYARGGAGVGPEPSVVISVDDINASLQKIRDAGGKVLNEPFEIPEIGRYAAFTDTEGNRVGVLQPVPRNQ